MTYDYNSKIYLAEAVLNVKDLARQTAFYTQIIGFEILSQTEKEVILGAGNSVLKHHLAKSLHQQEIKTSKQRVVSKFLVTNNHFNLVS